MTAAIQDEMDNAVQFNVRGVLLDIEGTTSSISFVYDVMFPYVREHLRNFLESNWGSEQLNEVIKSLEKDAAGIGISADLNSVANVQLFVQQLMDGDHKTTGLKKLQGIIWKDGFESGELVSHVYEDVAPAIKQWKDAGCDIRIYSSGSVQAQRLFFGHTQVGNLLDHFSSHYDTTTGPKKETQSYQTIARDFNVAPEQILFISDVTAELAAAKQAGFKVVLSNRPGNPAQENADHFALIESFEQLKLIP